MVVKPITAASIGLFIAWAVHDAEELLTMSETSRRVFAQLPQAVPIPDSLRARGLSQTHVNLSIGLMAVPMALASIQGVRTQGKSRWFRGSLLAFGVHGFTHIASSALMRGYTTGVATAPLIVIPYWLCARGILRRQGVDAEQATTGAALSLVPLTIGAHLLSARILGEESVAKTR